MIAEIIGVGTGPMLRDIVNADSQTLSQELSLLGIEVRYQCAVGASKQGLQQAMAEALRRSDVIITTGGLGMEPTDFTKKTICKGLGIPLELHPDSFARVRAYYEAAGIPMPPEAQELATLPQGSVVFPSDNGLAPGCAISAGDQCIVMLPGPPDEIVPMLLNYVYPYLAGFAQAVVVSRTARIFGLPDHQVEQKLGDLLRGRNPVAAVYQCCGEVLVHVSARANTKAQAANMCTPLLKEVVNRLGDYVYGIDISSLEQAVVTHLKQKGLHIAVAEACSGTPLTQRLNAVPGASAVFEFGISAYANRVKHDVLKVPEKVIKKFGAVSDQVAVHMACGAMDAGESDIGVAVTGAMGPQAEGDRPVGLVYIAVCNKDSVVVRKLSLSPERSPAQLQEQAAMHALNLVRLILDYDPEPYPGAVPLGAALKGKVPLCDETMSAAAIAAIPEAGRRQRGGKKAAAQGKRRWYHVILPCKGDGAFDVIRKLLVIVFLGVFVGSSVYIGSYYYERFATKNLYQSLADLIDKGKDPGDVDGYPEEYQPKFAAYWEQNHDFKGWLSIDDTQVNYPVVQAADNDYYLRRDFERKDNQHGVPFLDYEVELDPQSDNSIIYGHNMKDGQMFGELLGYKDVEYLKEHPIIHFDSVYENADYKVAAVFLASTEQDHGPKFRYEQFVNAASDEEFMDFVDQIQMRSMIDTGVDIQEGDKLLTLSTCSYEFWEARFVVVGRKVRDDEDSEVDTSEISVNPEPLMPDVYYEVTKSQKPAKYEGMGAWAPSNSKARTTPTSGGVISGTGDAAGPAGPVAAKDPGSSSEEEEEEESSSSKEESSSSKEESSSSKAESSSQAVSSSSRAESSSQAVSSSSKAASSSSKAESSSSAPNIKVNNSSSSKKEEESSSSGVTPRLNVRGTSANKSSSSDDDDDDEDDVDFWDPDYTYDEDEDSSSDDEDKWWDDFDVYEYDADDDITVKVGDKDYKAPAEEVIGRIVLAEMGRSFDTEALKAQAVAAFTYINYYGSRGQKASVTLDKNASIPSKIKNAVEEVIGEQILYDGKPINAVYFASSAGATNNAEDVWGSEIPYLKSVDSDEDVPEKIVRIKRSTMKELLDKQGISTKKVDDEDEWFDDFKMCDNDLYVDTLKVCGKKKTGRWVRETLLSMKIPSTAFEVYYDSSDKVFEFTCYGSGHGVGMSQMGAQEMAEDGDSYRDILRHYYSGCRVR